MEAKILSVKSRPFGGLIVEIDTREEIIPPGIKHGRYTLICTPEFICDDLPDEMFVI